MTYIPLKCQKMGFLMHTKDLQQGWLEYIKHKYCTIESKNPLFSVFFFNDF